MLLQLETAPVLDPETEHGWGPAPGPPLTPQALLSHLCALVCRAGAWPRGAVTQETHSPSFSLAFGAPRLGLGCGCPEDPGPPASLWEPVALLFSGALSSESAGKRFRAEKWEVGDRLCPVSPVGLGALRPTPGKVTVSSAVFAVFPVALRGRLLVEGSLKRTEIQTSER